MNYEDPKDWLKEIHAAKRREKKFREVGEELTKIYEAETPEENVYNILWANTETLLPTLYSNTPVPVVRRRFDKDASPLGKALSAVLQRSLAYFIDPAGQDNSPFNTLISKSVVQGLVPGRGLIRVKYDFTAKEVEVPDDEGDHPNVAESEEALEQGEQPQEQLQSERVELEVVDWNRFTHSYAKSWDRVWWEAFEHEYTKVELKELMGGNLPEDLDKLFVRSSTATDDEPKKSSDNSEPTICVQEVWDKRCKCVRFLTESHDFFLKKVPDPLGFIGFFPNPEPLVFTNTISGMVPKAQYLFYKNQAKELNRVSTRINKIIETLKVRGLYDANVADLAEVAKLEDGHFHPTRNSTILAQGKALDAALWIWPLKDIVPVLQQLYQQRREIRQVIFEICGIADIMRGSTAASETLGAQELKTQWGTLRLKQSQRRVQEFVRQTLRLMAHVISNKFQPSTVVEITQLRYPTVEEKQQLQARFAELQASGQPDPDMQQMLQLALDVPTWNDIFAAMRNKMAQAYLIDIETDSTVDVEATKDHKDLQEVLAALSQALQGITPLVQEGVMDFNVAKSFLLTVCRKYRFGPDFEDELERLKQPTPKPDPKVEMMKEQAQIDQKMAADEHQLRMAELSAKLNADMEKMRMQLEVAQQKQAMEMQKMQMEMTKMMQDFQLGQREHAARLEEIVINAKAQRMAGSQNAGGKKPASMQK